MKTRWTLQKRTGGIEVLRPKEKARPFSDLLDEIHDDRSPLFIDLRFLVEQDLTPASTREEARERGETQARLASLDRTTIALLSGEVTGCALEYALCCTHRFATPDTSFLFPEVSLGLLPAGETLWRLEECAGLHAFFSLVIKGGRCSLEHARDLGLVQAVSVKEKLFEQTPGVLHPMLKKKRNRKLYRTRLGGYLFKRQALSELSGRRAPCAAQKAVELFFNAKKKTGADRIRLVAEAIQALSLGDERRALLRMKEISETHSPGTGDGAKNGDGKTGVKRALLLMGTEGWKWAELLALYGIRVRWCGKDAKALADGICWIQRDLDRYFPDKADPAVNLITVSETVCGFRGRGLVVCDDAALLSDDAASLLPDKSIVFVDAAGAEKAGDRRPEAGRHRSFCRIAFPYDPLTSRVVRVFEEEDANGPAGAAGRDDARKQTEQLLRGFGFLPLPPREAAAVFSAVERFKTRWARLKEEGFTDKSVIASLKSFGFPTHVFLRRLMISGKLKKEPCDNAYELICSLWKSMRDGEHESCDTGLVDLALTLELGFPQHLGGPFGFLEMIKSNPNILSRFSLGKPSII